MLRAGRAARERKLELLVVDMPEGLDPADLIASHGPDAFRERLSRAREVPDFHARRVVAQADLSSSRERDQALGEVRPLVAELAGKPATRDELVRYLADRLDVPRDYLLGQSPAQFTRPEPRDGATSRPALPLDAVSKAERELLTMCWLSELGKEYVERLGDDHFSSNPMRRVRDHLAEHWENPLAALPENEPTLAAAIKAVVMPADEVHVSDEVLRVAFLHSELRLLERKLRHAAQEEDLPGQRALQQEREQIRTQLHDLMGATL
jgi:DNA primase